MNEFDIYHTIRSQASRGMVGAVYDNGPEQMVDLNIHAGQVRTKVSLNSHTHGGVQPGGGKTGGPS